MAVVLASILILVSGRAQWERAWAYVVVTFSVQVIVVTQLHRTDPDLLVERQRMQPGTKNWDKVLAPFIALVGPIAMWVVAALDVRLHWRPVLSLAWSAVGFLLCIAGSLLVFRAMLVNRFFSATVRIQADRGHTVVDRGPYAYVRHPGYVGAMAFTVGTPLALGSSWAMIPAALTVLVLVVRTALEDATLRSELPGYREYAQRVRCRLVPGIW
jgi:protein-S-isoprenylcysteine O-methyltransferase Ste14